MSTLHSLPPAVESSAPTAPGVATSARSTSRWWTVAQVLSLALTVGAWALAVPYMPRDGVDPAYQVALNAAARQGLVFGREVVFTFGPLGFLHVAMFDPVLFPWNVAFDLAFGVVLALNALVVARMRTPRDGLLLLIALPFVVRLGHEADARVFLFAAVVASTLLGLRQQMPVWLVLADVAILSLLALVKFTFLLLAAGVIGAVTLDLWLSRRRAGAVVPIVALLVAGAGWIGSGQPLAAIPDFVRGGFEVSRGYTAGLSRPGPAGEVLLYVVAAVMLLTAVLRDGWRRRPMRAALHTIVLAAIVFMAFKNGFTRHLYHRTAATTAIAAIATWYAAAWWPECGPRERRALAAAVVVAVLCGLTTAPARVALEPATPAALYRSMVSQIERVGQAWTGWEADRRRYTAARNQIRRQHRLPPVEGSVDVLGLRQDMLLMHDVDWKPRPVFQAYSAVTPALLERNARHLRDDGPRTLFADIGTTDDRMPMGDQGRAVLEVLRHYDVGEQPGEVVVLRRRDTPRDVRLEPVLAVDARVGEPVALPAAAGTMLWARITLEPTWLGRLALFAFRSSEVEVGLELASGAQGVFRIIPSMAADGFLLSPLVLHPNAFGRVLSADGAARLSDFAVRRITVRERGGPVGPLWASAVRIEVDRVAVDGLPSLPETPAHGAPLDLMTNIATWNATVERAPTGVRVVANGPGPHAVLAPMAPSSAAEQRTLVLDVDLPVADVVRIYWGDDRHPFGEDRCLRQQLPAGRHRLRVPIPRGRRAARIRIDGCARCAGWTMRGVVEVERPAQAAGGTASSSRMSSSERDRSHSG